MKDHDVGIRPCAVFWQIETVTVDSTWWTFTHSHLLEVAIAFRAKFEGSAHWSHARRPTVLPDDPNELRQSSRGRRSGRVSSRPAFRPQAGPWKQKSLEPTKQWPKLFGKTIDPSGGSFALTSLPRFADLEWRSIEFSDEQGSLKEIHQIVDGPPRAAPGPSSKALDRGARSCLKG